jgi:hypothetical protein
VHSRPWSSAIRVESSRGRLWFKVNGPGTSHEPALLQVLADRVPGLVPEPLAVDPGRGWSLCRDAGPVLRQVLSPHEAWAAWEQVVVRYADAQLQLAGERDVVLGTGLREVWPRTVPGQAQVLLDELARLPVGRGGLRSRDAARLAGVLPRLESWCGELASSGLPESVQHDDLHAGNICWSGRGETARVIDWGDAVWGFPLTTMYTTMRSLARHAGLPVTGPYVDRQRAERGQVEAPEVLRVRDAYLEPFTGWVDHAGLVHLVDVARRTGCVGKALAFRAALQGAPLSVQAGLGFPVRACLLELLG